MIQIRNVPEDLHRRLKAKAARLGMSLSDYLLSEIRPLADRPTREEVLEQIRTLRGEGLDIDGAQIIRELRGPLP